MYEIDDHLSNVRAVIGSTYTNTYTATMESENATVEDAQFVNIAPRSAWVNPIVVPAAPAGNEAVVLSNSRPMGPGIVFKVAPGDVITAQVDAYYEGGTGYSNTLPLATIIGAVADAFGGISGGPLGDPGTAIFDAFDDAYSGGFAGGAGSSDDAVPAAWLNLVMFSGSMDTDPLTLPMSAIQVSSAANLARETLTIGPIDIPAPGYIYIYVNCNSNTTNTVTFDNLEVTHLHAPFVAGGDYYPFGLPIADRQIDVEPYRWGYQGQFSEKDSVTGWNEFDLRMYDARFGRWLSPDPYGQFASPYSAMGNDPQSGTDPSGGLFGLLTPWSQVAGTLTGAAVGAGLGIAIDWLNDGKVDDGYWLYGAVAGGLAGFVIGEYTAGYETNRYGSPNTRSRTGGKLHTNEGRTHRPMDNLRERVRIKEPKMVERPLALTRESSDIHEFSTSFVELGGALLQDSWQYWIRISRPSGTARVIRGAQVKEYEAGSTNTYTVPKGTSRVRIEVEPDRRKNEIFWRDYNYNRELVHPGNGEAQIVLRGLTPRMKVTVRRSGLLGLRVHRKSVKVIE